MYQKVESNVIGSHDDDVEYITSTFIDFIHYTNFIVFSTTW